MKFCALIVVKVHIKKVHHCAAAGLLMAFLCMLLTPIKLKHRNLLSLVALASVACVGAVASAVDNVPNAVIQWKVEDLCKSAAELRDIT